MTDDKYNKTDYTKPCYTYDKGCRDDNEEDDDFFDGIAQGDYDLGAIIVGAVILAVAGSIFYFFL